jgi:hypothetical protein
MFAVGSAGTRGATSNSVGIVLGISFGTAESTLTRV